MKPSIQNRLIAGSLFSVSCTAIIGWFLWPALLLATAPLLDEKGEEDGQWLRDQLVSCGPRAIKPVIRQIRSGFWSRNYAYLPQVLGRLGDPAHRVLLEAIVTEDDPSAHAYLISALQQGFGDYSRLGRWLTQASSAQPYVVRHLSWEIRGVFTNAPELCYESRVNPAFVAWWISNSIPIHVR